MKTFLFILFSLIKTTAYASTSSFEFKKYPNVSIKLHGIKEAIECKVDGKVEVYLCDHLDKKILIKKNTYDFSAIGIDEKGEPKVHIVENIKTESKALFEIPKVVIPITNTLPVNASTNYKDKVSAVKYFFGTSDKKGSAEYESLAKKFIEQSELLQKKYEEAFTAKNYQVELEDGQKLNCSRGTTKALTEEEEKYSRDMNATIQCGAFSCESVTANGKKYQATLMFESKPLFYSRPSIHLTDKDDFGPAVNIKKITSELVDEPLVDLTGIKNQKTDSMQSYFPQSLGEDRSKIAYYKNPVFVQSFNFNEHFCGDKNVLAPLADAKKKLLTKIAELEMAEFIQVMADGSLIGQYIDPGLAPEYGCYYNGVYLDPLAEQHLNKLKKNIYPDRVVDQTISLDRAKELFQKATQMKDIAWKYKPDGCYARAHLMARRFEAEGVRVDKVWIKGDLAVPEANIRWNFHVAPIVYVEDDKGQVKKMVIDPSLFDRPVTVEEWDNKMTKNTIRGSTVTAFPFPENAAFYERSALAFSSSDPYLPRDSIHMSENEKMEMANDTMSMYKPLEPK